MGKFTSAFVVIIAGGFFAVALRALQLGAYQPAIAAAVFGALVLLIGAIGWFDKRFPLPPLPSNERTTLIGAAARYWRAYPGWPGRVAAVFLVLVVVGVVLKFVGNVLGY
ncbi:MAG: hypothetical protein V4787_24205 [Pseudomonadota bacterium]